MIDATVIEDSVSSSGVRLTTLQLKYPRYIHAEFLTHRMLSRNASSSRAIPVSKAADMALSEMVEPIRYGTNQPGMQAADGNLSGEALEKARKIWATMAAQCATGARELAELGLHKQWANRPTEWFSHIQVVVTATEWDNFFELRDHPDAQPEIHALAKAMRSAMDNSTPVVRVATMGALDQSSWHLPYVKGIEREYYLCSLLPKLSAARCARVSYMTHDGEFPNVAKDLALFDKLVGSRPMHASPVEHQAYPAQSSMSKSGNFVGWVQHRQVLEHNV